MLPRLFIVLFLISHAAFVYSQEEAERLMLWPSGAPLGDGSSEKADVPITVHRPAPEKANGAAMIICPGGGYGNLVTGPEGHGIAKWLVDHGIAGVVLEYRLPRQRPFVPLLDAQRTIRTVRAHAEEWGVNPDRIGVIGFSAGGHLASTALTHFDAGDLDAEDPIERLSSRPDFGVLIYPVVSMGEISHGGSRRNLLGTDPKPELIEHFSNEKQVTQNTPPVFLAHAFDDKPVAPAHSKLLYQALLDNSIPAKYLELPYGGHGLNGYKGPMWNAWQKGSLHWLKELKFLD